VFIFVALEYLFSPSATEEQWRLKESEKRTAMDSIRVFDLSTYLQEGAKDESVLAECRAMAEHIHETGILIIKDPRYGHFCAFIDDHPSH